MRAVKIFVAGVFFSGFCSHFALAATSLSVLGDISKGELWSSECTNRGLDAAGKPEAFPLNRQSSQTHLSILLDGTSYISINIFSKVDCQGDLAGIFVMTGKINDAKNMFTLDMKNSLIMPLDDAAVAFVKAGYTSPACHVVKGMPVASDCAIDEISAKMPDTLDLPFNFDGSGKELTLMDYRLKKAD